MKTKQDRIREAEERCRAEVEAIEAEGGWLSDSDITVAYGIGDDAYYIRTDHIFSTGELAIQEAERIQLYLRMRKFADENNGEFTPVRFYLYVDRKQNRINLGKQHPDCDDPMIIYFSSEPIAEKAREKFGPEILRVWGK